MNIKAMQKRLRDFAAARDWESFHSPKNLAMALMVESAELLELFQWLTTAQSHTLTQAPEDREKVSDEIADVLLYLLQIADKTGIDIEEAVEKKLIKNAHKHPAKHPQADPPGPKVHLLVDWENVKPDAAALKQLVPEGTDVWLFHPPAQRMDVEQHKKVYGSNSVTLVERTGSGKNALDFQLSYYAGYLMARQPGARFVVVSNDKGYEPMLEHARKLEFQAMRAEYYKPAKKVVPVESKPAEPLKTKPLKLKTVASRPAELTPPLPAAEPTSARIAFRVKNRLSWLPVDQRPATWTALLLLAQSLIVESVADKSDLAEKACKVLQLYGTVMRDVDNGNVKYQGIEATMSSAALVPELAKPVSASLVSPVSTTQTAHKKTRKEQPAVKPTLKTEAGVGAKANKEKRTQPAAKSQFKVAVQTGAKPKQAVSHIAKKVEASLKKMSPNLPSQREGLMKVIATHFNPSTAQDMTPQQVCVVLQARQVVKISPQGVVLYFGAAKSIKPQSSAVPQQA